MNQNLAGSAGFLLLDQCILMGEGESPRCHHTKAQWQDCPIPTECVDGEFFIRITDLNGKKKLPMSCFTWNFQSSLPEKTIKLT